MASYTDVNSYGADPAPLPGALTVLFGWAGAMMSIALIVGLGVWGYQLAKRDVSGVPVVRALEGPMRVQPEDPGGAQAAHQGLAVNSVAAEGSAEAPADRMVLAPAPTTPTAEDMPRTELAATQPAPEADPAPAVFDTAAAAALAEALAADAAPLELSAEAEAGAEAAAEPALTDVTPVIAPLVPETTAGVSRSLRPQARPSFIDHTARAVATEVALAVSRPSGREVAPEAVPAGTRLVQFGAYDSADMARAAWDGLQGRFSAFMTGKSRVVQEAVSGGKTFYRLRAMGFVDLNDARRFCAALVAERQACIPVVVR